MHKGLLTISFIVIISFIFLPLESSLAAIRKHQPRQKKSIVSHKNSNIKDTAFYTVKKGDTLYRIAKLHGLSVDELKELNGLKISKLKIGQRLILMPEKEIKPESPSPEERKIEESEPTKKAALSEDFSNNQNQISECPAVKVKEEEKGIIAKVLSYSKDLLGIPYRFGGTTLRALDCSAFVQKVFKSIGIDLPRTAREQFNLGRDVGREEIAEGDLVFFKTYSRYPSHVGIYIGDNQFIHASRKGRQVSIDSLEEPYYRKRFIGAKRLIEVEVTTESPGSNKSG